MKTRSLFLLWVACWLTACNPSAGNPRGAVVKFIAAVQTADTLSILRGMTMQASYSMLPDTGLQVSGAAADTIMTARLIAELLPGGAIQRRWLDQRLVVGDAEVRGDTAYVEVTRMDQIKGQNFYNKFGLVNKRGYWQIFSFRTQPGPGL